MCEGRRGGASSAVEVAVVVAQQRKMLPRPACRFISDDDIIDNAVRSPITVAMSRIGDERSATSERA
jgi:hypothetical protein